MADDAKKKAAENARKRAQSARYRKEGEAKQATYNKEQRKLERLKTAKRSLDRQIGKMQQFHSHVNSVASSVSSGSFKGTLEKKVQDNVKKLATDINSDINHYQQAESSLNAKISSLEASQGELMSAISSAFAVAEDFLKSLV